MLRSRISARHPVACVLSVAVTALLFLPATESHAQGTAAASLNEIVVTGSRVTRDGYEAPTTVSVLGADELNALNTVNEADTVNTLPALQAR